MKIEEKVLQYRILESRLNQLIQQRSFVESRLGEIEITKETLNEIAEVGEKDILISIGSLTYANAKLSKVDKVLVEVGANVALEKSINEAIKILERRKNNLNEIVDRLDEEIRRVSEMMRILENEIGKVSK